MHAVLSSIHPLNLTYFIRWLPAPHLIAATQPTCLHTALTEYFIPHATHPDVLAPGPQVVGRDSEVQRVVQILGRKTKSSAVLLGEAGVGKTAVVEGIASCIAAGSLPDGSLLPRYLVRCGAVLH
jgi:hypothetical protein